MTIKTALSSNINKSISTSWNETMKYSLKKIKARDDIKDKDNTIPLKVTFPKLNSSSV